MQNLQPEQSHARNGLCVPISPPDPQVKPTGRRRKFTAGQKLKFLEATDGLSKGDVGAFLRQNGLYWSCLSKWRKQREEGLLKVLEPKKRGCPVRSPEMRRAAELERENAQLRIKLSQAETIIDVQKKLCDLFGAPLKSPS